MKVRTNAARGFALAIGIACAVSAAAEEAATPLDALLAGKAGINLRPRYEHVEQDGRAYDANALTLRTLIDWQSGSWKGFSGFAQLIDVGRANDNYNDTRNGRTRFPVVADPDNTDINQLYLDYSGLPDTRLRLGRQSIKLDNVRFVGNVEFRQIMQVFNGITVENRSMPNLILTGGHLERLKTIVGDQQEIRLEMLNAAYQWREGNRVVAFGYFHDSPRTASATGFADNSNRILGLRADGAYPLDERMTLLYTAEYAIQDDYAGGDARIDADYLHAGIGAGWASFYLRADYEQLSSNGGVYGFQTPLGTNHLFQGWADLFLSTPAQGIRDMYVSAGGKLGKAQWSAAWHDLRSDFGGIRYGSELDIGVSYPLYKKLAGKFEYASFKEEDVLGGAARKPDTDKIWLTLTYSYP